MEDRLARWSLARLSEPGDVRLADLVGRFGAAQVMDLLRSEQDVAGVYTDVARRLRQIDAVREMEEAAARGIRFVVPGDAEWPVSLDDLTHAEPVQRRGGAPLGLWLRGPLRLEEATERSVAVVGSRSATTYGQGVAGDIAAHLASHGCCVVSGAAYGIDVAAHRGAAAMRGATVAVLACGVDRFYPSGNRPMLQHLAETGLIASEVPPGGAPTRLRFLVRNRLIAALGHGTVVVEAALRSGALSTAHWAARLGRVVMGVPGPVTSAPSQGVHELLRAGAATLVTGGADVLECVAPVGESMLPERRGDQRPRDRLDAVAAQVLEAVPVVQAVSAQSVARTAGVDLAATSAALDRLHRLGLVRSTGDRWRLAAAAVSGGGGTASTS